MLPISTGSSAPVGTRRDKLIQGSTPTATLCGDKFLGSPEKNQSDEAFDVFPNEMLKHVETHRDVSPQSVFATKKPCSPKKFTKNTSIKPRSFYFVFQTQLHLFRLDIHRDPNSTSRSTDRPASAGADRPCSESLWRPSARRRGGDALGAPQFQEQGVPWSAGAMPQSRGWKKGHGPKESLPRF